MYTVEEAKRASLEYFAGNELAADVWKKYQLKGVNDEILEKTPEEMHRRMAREFARVEKKKFKDPYSEDFIFGLFDQFKYIIPQGSPMSGIGNYHQYVSLSNCFVKGTKVFTTKG